MNQTPLFFGFSLFPSLSLVGFISLCRQDTDAQKVPVVGKHGGQCSLLDCLPFVEKYKNILVYYDTIGGFVAFERVETERDVIPSFDIPK